MHTCERSLEQRARNAHDHNEQTLLVSLINTRTTSKTGLYLKMTAIEESFDAMLSLLKMQSTYCIRCGAKDSSVTHEPMFPSQMTIITLQGRLCRLAYPLCLE